MIDNDIVKVFEERIQKEEHPGFVLCGQILSLINRQKAELDDLKRDDLPRCKDALRRANEIGMGLEKENQKLRAEIERLGCDLAVARGLLSRVDSSLVATRNNARAEAIKEFAERLQKHSYFDPKDQRKVVAEVIIDHYIKEMVGEDK